MKLKPSIGIYAYLLSILIPVVAYYTGGYLLMAACLYILVVFWNQHGSRVKMPVLLAPFLCLYLMDLVSSVVRGQFAFTKAYSMLAAYLPVFLGLQVGSLNQQQAKKLFKFIMLLHSIVAVTTLLVLAEDPNAARFLATGEGGSYTDSLEKRNTADYMIIYTLAISFPLFGLASKQALISKPLFFAYGWLIGAVVLLANYAMAILIFVMAVIICLLPGDLKKSNLWIVALGIVIVIVFLPDYLGRGLELLGESVGEFKVKQKLDDLAGALRGEELGNRDTVGRMELYQYSWRHFLESPLVGHWYQARDRWGGHSYILDNMAKYGIFGAVVVGAQYGAVYKCLIKPQEKETSYVPLVLTMVLGIIVSLLNTGMWVNVTVLYVAVLLRAIKPDREEQTAR